MLRAVQFDFPIRRADYGFWDERFRTAVVGTLVPANRTRLVRASVNVNHVRHWPDYIANCSILLGLGDKYAKESSQPKKLLTMASATVASNRQRADYIGTILGPCGGRDAQLNLESVVEKMKVSELHAARPLKSICAANALIGT
jgi:hypothetical protein